MQKASYVVQIQKDFRNVCMRVILRRGCFCVGVFPLSPCAALIRGMLLTVFPHGCPFSLGEEAETGEGC